MTTNKIGSSLAFRRLKGFLKELRSSRRGFAGLIIIVLFVLVAAIGPRLTTLDPLEPQWKGYYPAGPIPASLELCVPLWYRSLPGGADKYSENFEAVLDYTFSSTQSLNAWNPAVSDPDLATITYNAERGNQNDGTIEIRYNRQAEQTAPDNGTIVTLTYPFTYPYSVFPGQFWIHTSCYVEGTVSQDTNVSLRYSFLRKDQTPLTNYIYPDSLITSEGPLTVYHYPLTALLFTSPTGEWKNEWIRSTRPEIFHDPKYYLNPGAIVFPRKGDYQFIIEVIFKDAGDSAKDATVFLDNINALLYGNAFGLLGSDGVTGQPRDIFTALVHGAEISVIVGLLVATFSVTIGLVMGLTAGYFGGLTDEAIMRLADFLIGLPGLPLLIVMAVILKPSVFNVVMLLVFLGWMTFSRNIRSVTLSLRERSFVEAARASGSSRSRILFKHIMPNVFPLVYLALAVSVPGAIVAEASLSFLGLFDPTRITWGRMFNEFTKSGVALTKGFSEYWFWILPPGIAISALAISFILLGYSLDEILNPKTRKRR